MTPIYTSILATSTAFLSFVGKRAETAGKSGKGTKTLRNGRILDFGHHLLICILQADLLATVLMGGASLALRMEEMWLRDRTVQFGG
jgi:hypothetical protein